MELSDITANLDNFIGPDKTGASVKQYLLDERIIATYNKVTGKLSRLEF